MHLFIINLKPLLESPPKIIAHTMEWPAFKEVQPLFAIVENIHSTANLVKEGCKPRLKRLILPSLAMTFGTALLTNSLDGSFSKITARDIAIYLIGFVLSLRLFSSESFLSITKEVPMVMRVISSMELVENTECSFDVLKIRFTKFFVGLILQRLILRKKMKLERSDLLGAALYHGIFYLIRLYKLPSFAAVLMVCPVPLFKRLSCYMRTCKRTCKAKPIRRQPVLHTPAEKLPRRKASVAAQLSVKNKDL